MYCEELWHYQLRIKHDRETLVPETRTIALRWEKRWLPIYIHVTAITLCGCCITHIWGTKQLGSKGWFSSGQTSSKKCGFILDLANFSPIVIANSIHPPSKLTFRIQLFCTSNMGDTASTQRIGSYVYIFREPTFFFFEGDGSCFRDQCFSIVFNS